MISRKGLWAEYEKIDAENTLVVLLLN